MSEALENQKEKERLRCVAGITTYTLGSYTKDDSFVRVGYALSSVGLGTAFEYANVRIPKLDNGEIDTTNFIINLQEYEPDWIILGALKAAFLFELGEGN